MLLRAFAPLYLAIEARHLRASTAADYRRVLDVHVLPLLGDRALHRLTTRDALALQARLLDHPARANRAVTVLLRIAKIARMMGHHVGTLERPRRLREGRRERYLSRDEALRLLAVLDRRHDVAAVVVRLALLTGCRRGELLALRWSEVDLERNLLRLADSKTGAREVPLSSDAAVTLAALPRAGDHVFPGSHVHVRSVDRAWRTIRRDAGIPDVRLHDLRHAWASFAISAGVTLPIVGAVLGHRTPLTTSRYAHVHRDAAARAVETVAGILARPL